MLSSWLFLSFDPSYNVFQQGIGYELYAEEHEWW